MGAIHHTVGGAVGGTHQAIHTGDVIIVQPWAAGVGVAVRGAAQVRVGGQAAPVHEAVRREPSWSSQVVGPKLWPSKEGVCLTCSQPRFSSPGSILGILNRPLSLPRVIPKHRAKSLSAAQNETNTTGHGVTLGWGTNKNGVCSTRELRQEALPCHRG